MIYCNYSTYITSILGNSRFLSWISPEYVVSKIILTFFIISLGAITISSELSNANFPLTVASFNTAFFTISCNFPSILTVLMDSLLFSILIIQLIVMLSSLIATSSRKLLSSRIITSLFGIVTMIKATPAMHKTKITWPTGKNRRRKWRECRESFWL